MTTNEIQVFSNSQFGDIRTIISAFETKNVPYILWSQRGTLENIQKLKVS